MTKLKTISRIILNRYFDRISPNLHYINISITTLCNLKCIMCEARDFRPESYGSMELSTFKKIIDEALPLGLETINLSAQGESTLHPDFAEMVDYAYLKGIKLRLVTNLTILDEEILQALCRFEQIHVSVDGITKKTYEDIRRGANWEVLLKNIKRLKDTVKHTKIVANFCVQNANFHEFPEAKEKLISLGFDDVNFGNLMDMNKKHTGQISQAKIKRTEYNPLEVPCYHYHFGMYVNTMGNVYPCAMYDYHEGFTGEKLFCAGNVKETSVKDIWTKPPMTDIRKEFLKGKHGEPCRCCSFKTNKKIHDVVKYVL